MKSVARRKQKPTPRVPVVQSVGAGPTDSLAIEDVPLGELHEDPSNVRKHSPRNLGAIKASLVRFGQRKPIVVGPGNVVVAGNGTLAAARELGWPTVAVVRTALAGAEATAFAIADNRTAELAEWDEGGLSSMLDALREQDAELAAATGFLDAEMEKLAQQARGNDVTEDEPPEPPANPVTKPGDLWTLGGHRLLCGDCRETLQRFKADVLVTDPPYGIGYRTPSGRRRPKGGMTVEGDDVPFDPAHLLALGLPSVMFGANHYADKLPPSPGWIVWDKRCGEMPSNRQGDAEMAWANMLGAVRIVRCLWNGGGSLLAENGPARAIHPTQKPVKLMVAVLELAADEGATVLDPYSGTGTTLIAAEQLGRKCVGIELSPAYCDVIVQRWETLTGGKATREHAS